MNLTSYQAMYFAHELAKRCVRGAGAVAGAHGDRSQDDYKNNQKKR